MNNMTEIKTFVDASYHLPWSEKDGPNGWIEPTTFCQLQCPGCYRGLDKDGPPRIHEDLAEMKKQVDRFITEKNVQTISVAGGEPLLYPQLRELLSYIKEKGLRTKIFTNGVALNEYVLRQLKDAGADEFIIHIDKSQRRPTIKKNNNEIRNEHQINILRDSYCQLFRKVGGVNLGFIQPVSKGSLPDVNIILRFCKQNADIVSLVVFTLYTDVDWTAEMRKNIDTNISIPDVISEIKKEFSYIPCSYLGSTSNTQDPSWLFSISVGFKNEVLGFFDGKIYRAIQERYHMRQRRYLYTKVGNSITLKQLLGLGHFACVRSILVNYMKAIAKNPSRRSETIFLQTLLILRGPKFMANGTRDLCEGCPDAMFYQGQLVPSCILEEIKAGKYADGVAA